MESIDKNNICEFCKHQSQKNFSKAENAIAMKDRIHATFQNVFAILSMIMNNL